MNNISFSQNELIGFYETVSNEVKQELSKYYGSYIKQYGIDSDEFLFVLRQRLEKEKLLRPFVSYMSFMATKRDYLLHKYKEIVLPLMVVSELFNMSTYQTNYILDKKFLYLLKNTNNQLLYSVFSMSICHSIIQQIEVDNQGKNSIWRLLSECNEKVYLGQNIDINVLSFTNINELQSFEYKEIERLYLKRCMLLGGSTINFALLCSFKVEASYEKELFDDFSQIGDIYGGLMQLLNDLDDFLNGNLSDIKNGKVSCFLWSIIKNHDYNQKRVLTFLEELSLSDKKDIIQKSEVRLLVERKFEQIELIYQKYSDLKLDNLFSIFYETIFRSNFYSQAFQ